jgi:hypothetical protein
VIGVPDGTVKTDQSTPSLPGPEWPASLANTITMTITISSTVIPSAASSTRVPPRAGLMASHQTSSRPAAPSRKPAQVGWFVQIPTESRKPAANRPPAIAVVTA